MCDYRFFFFFSNYFGNHFVPHGTIPGSNELQWLDVTIRRPTAQTNVEGAAMTAGHAAMMGEKEKTKKYGNRAEVGPDTVKPISIELGGRMGTQTIGILQGMTSKLADASGGEINAASALENEALVGKNVDTFGG